jgi:hypothetical protein
VSNFKRLGFTDADLIPPGSDKLVDALIAYGTPTRSPSALASICGPGPTTS